MVFLFDHGKDLAGGGSILDKAGIFAGDSEIDGGERLFSLVDDETEHAMLCEHLT